MSASWIEVNGAALRYVFDGTGSGTLVLVHEAGGSLESWDAVVPGLAPHYRVLRYDQRGFGLSERCRTLSVDRMVEDLRCLLEALSVREPVHLAGTAIGGTLVMEFAARHPERVASVIATSPVTGPLPEGAAEFLEQRAQLAEQQGMRAIEEISLEKSYPLRLRDSNGRFEQYRRRFLANDPRSFAALTRTYGTVDLQRIYHRIPCPVLIIGCTYDPIMPPPACAAVATALPAGRFVEVSSGHFIAMQSPEEFVNYVTEFLGQRDD